MKAKVSPANTANTAKITKTKPGKRKADPETRLRQVIEKWFITEPLLFSTFLTHKLVQNPHVETIRTGQGHIEYHPGFVDALDDETLEDVIKLETIRIVLKHPYARRPSSGEITYLASNITLKEHLRTSLPLPTAAQIFGNDSLSGQYYELYCDRLMDKSAPKTKMSTNSSAGADAPAASGREKAEKAEKAGEAGEAGEDGVAGESVDAPGQASADVAGADENEEEPADTAAHDTTKDEPRSAADHFDTSSGPERTQLWQEDSLVRERIDTAIREAEMSQAWGSLPGRLVSRILATLKPRVDYRKILRSFGTSILASRRELTRCKPSRRYGFDYMGSRYALRTKLLVAVDVSGSISDPDLVHAYSVINRLFQYGIETIDTLQFDTELTGPVETFTRKRFQVKIKGRGGTNFDPVLKYIDKHREYDGLIIVTDGVAAKPSPPKNRHTKVLWLFTSESTFEMSAKMLAHIGRTAFIRPASAGETRRTGSGRS